MKKSAITFRVVCFLVCVLFLSVFMTADIIRIKDSVAAELGLPEPGKLLKSAGAGDDILITGLKLNPDNPFEFDFFIDTNRRKDSEIDRTDLMKQAEYFIAALTTPKEDIWVNLSPYEENRIIDESLEATDMGQALISQDYILKQLASSLTYPDTPVGRAYWQVVSSRAQASEKLHPKGQRQVQSDDLSKIWIMPDKAAVYEHDGGRVALLTEATMKVETATDFFKEDKHDCAGSEFGKNPDYPVNPVENCLLSAITTEVNHGRHFARLRQIYNAIILAEWFKSKFSDSFFKQIIDKGMVDGISSEDKNIKEKVFALYCRAFKKGSYDLIKKEDHKKRRYFSGGWTTASLDLTSSGIMPQLQRTFDAVLSWRMVSSGNGNEDDPLLKDAVSASAVEWLAKRTAGRRADFFVRKKCSIEELAKSGPWVLRVLDDRAALAFDRKQEILTVMGYDNASLFYQSLEHDNADVRFSALYAFWLYALENEVKSAMIERVVEALKKEKNESVLFQGREYVVELFLMERSGIEYEHIADLLFGEKKDEDGDQGIIKKIFSREKFSDNRGLLRDIDKLKRVISFCRSLDVDNVFDDIIDKTAFIVWAQKKYLFSPTLEQSGIAYAINMKLGFSGRVYYADVNLRYVKDMIADYYRKQINGAEIYFADSFDMRYRFKLQNISQNNYKIVNTSEPILSPGKEKKFDHMSRSAGSDDFSVIKVDPDGGKSSSALTEYEAGATAVFYEILTGRRNSSVYKNSSEVDVIGRVISFLEDGNKEAFISFARGMILKNGGRPNPGMDFFDRFWSVMHSAVKIFVTEGSLFGCALRGSVRETKMDNKEAEARIILKEFVTLRDMAYGFTQRETEFAAQENRYAQLCRMVEEGTGQTAEYQKELAELIFDLPPEMTFLTDQLERVDDVQLIYDELIYLLSSSDNRLWIIALAKLLRFTEEQQNDMFYAGTAELLPAYKRMFEYLKQWSVVGGRNGLHRYGGGWDLAGLYAVGRVFDYFAEIFRQNGLSPSWYFGSVNTEADNWKNQYSPEKLLRALNVNSTMPNATGFEELALFTIMAHKRDDIEKLYSSVAFTDIFERTAGLIARFDLPAAQYLSADVLVLMFGYLVLGTEDSDALWLKDLQLNDSGRHSEVFYTGYISPVDNVIVGLFNKVLGININVGMTIDQAIDQLRLGILKTSGKNAPVDPVTFPYTEWQKQAVIESGSNPLTESYLETIGLDRQSIKYDQRGWLERVKQHLMWRMNDQSFQSGSSAVADRMIEQFMPDIINNGGVNMAGVSIQSTDRTCFFKDMDVEQDFFTSAVPEFISFDYVADHEAVLN